jgi:H+/Cl- antiporter ClcA
MNITKEQIQNLTSEQQVTLASIEIQRAKKRQRLLDQARRRPAPWFAALLPALFGFALFLPRFFITSPIYLPFCVLGIALLLWGMILSQLNAVNRRLDALVELWEDDQKEGERKP